MVTDFIYDHWIVWAAPTAVAILLATFWFLRPLAPLVILRPIKGTVPFR